MNEERVIEEVRELAPSMKSVARTAETTLIRRAIWSLPKPIMWAGVIVVVVLAAAFGGR